MTRTAIVQSTCLGLVVCFAALAQTALPLSTAIPLNNGDFEGAYAAVNSNQIAIAGEIAQNWSDNSSWQVFAPTIRYSQETSNCHGGSACQKVVVASAGGSRFQMVQSFTAVGSSVYSVAVWVRGTAGNQVTLSIQQVNSPYRTFLTGSVSATDQWQQVRATGYVATGQNVVFMIASSQPGTIWIDDAGGSFVQGFKSAHPSLGPVSAQFFGMHVANYLQNTARNVGMEPPYVGAGLTNPISGQVAINWSDNSNWGTPVPVITYSQETGNCHGGTACQKIVVGSVDKDNAALQFVEGVTVVPGKKYTFSAWMRSDDAMPVRMLIRQQDSPYTAYNDGGYPAPIAVSSTWTRYAVTGTAGDAGALFLMFQSNSTGTVYIDDVSFTDVAGNAVNGGVPWPAAPFGTLRLWDSNTSWPWLEPQKGVWYWETLDMLVAEAERHGVRDILLTMGQTPMWASSSPDLVTYIGAGAPAPPINDSDWQDYVRAVATRYKGRIRYWEIWNEPNDTTYFTGTPERMISLTQQASQILHAVDPDNTVVAPVPYQTWYVDELLAGGIAAYVDALAYHIYTYAGLPETASDELNNVRMVMTNRNAGSMPLWDTEGASGDNTTTDETSAKYVVRRYLVDMAYGAARFNFDGWGSANKFWPSMRTASDPNRLTLAAKAYRYLAGWLRGATLVAAVSDPYNNNWTLTFRWADGRQGMIAWNPMASAVAPVQLDYLAGFTPRSAHDIWGGVTKLTGNLISLTDAPVLFTDSDDAPPSVASVANAAGAGNAIAPGSLAMLTGTNLAGYPETAVSYPLPRNLGLATVTLGDVECPLLYASPTAVIFQVPAALTTGATALTVASPAGLSTATTVTVSATGPGLFQEHGVAIALNADGRVNSVRTPARAGTALTVYLTGSGATVPPVDDGQSAPVAPLATATASATATVDWMTASVGAVTLIPGYAGLARATVTLPQVGAGTHSLAIGLGAATSMAVTIYTR